MAKLILCKKQHFHHVA